MNPSRVLFVGVRDDERSWLKSWFAAHGARAWFADRALSAMRAFEELEPDMVVLDTLLVDADPVRVARVFASASPDCAIAFVGNHGIEEAHYANLPELEGARFAFRPIDPEALVGKSDENAEVVAGVAARAETDGFGLAKVMFACERADFTGCLYLGEGATQRVVHWRDGAPIFVESMIPSENFGRLLMEWEVISRVEFEWARNLQLAEGIRQGEALVKIGVLNQDALQHLLRRQFGAKLTNALQITPLPYRLEAGTARIRGGGRAIDVMQTCVEGLSRVVEGDNARWREVAGRTVFVPEASSALDEAKLIGALGAELRSAFLAGVTPVELVAAGHDRDTVHGIVEALEAAGLIEDAAHVRASA